MIVADTNLIAYYFVQGPFTDEAFRVRARDAVWHAPPQWQGEFLNVLWGSIRFSGVSPSDADHAYSTAESYIRTETRPHFRQVLELALTSGCTTYDCEFVALAINKGVPLVTNDRKVLRAFPTVAVSLADFGK